MRLYDPFGMMRFSTFKKSDRSAFNQLLGLLCCFLFAASVLLPKEVVALHAEHTFRLDKIGCMGILQEPRIEQGIDKWPTFTSAKQTKPDSLAHRATQDLVELKKHAQLSKSQEEHIYNMFLTKHQYVEQLGTDGPRWELIRKTSIDKLRELLGDASFSQIEQEGLVEKWYGTEKSSDI